MQHCTKTSHTSETPRSRQDSSHGGRIPKSPRGGHESSVGIELTNRGAKDEGAAYYTPRSSKAATLRNSSKIGSDRARFSRLHGIVGSVAPYAHIPSRRPNVVASRDRSAGVATSL